MTDKVVHLSVATGTVAEDVKSDGYLAEIHKFLADTDTLEGWSADDVELEPGRSDEQRLGPLTSFERDCFIMGTLLNEVIKDAIIDIEADGTDQIASIMRAKRVSNQEAAMEYARGAAVSEDTRIFLNRAAVTQANTMSCYEWGVRTRYDAWDSRIVVRTGFVAHSFNG